MRRVVCTEIGPLDRLTVEEAELPPIGPGDVHMRIEAAGSFVDALLVKGLYQIPAVPPFTPGAEIAGVVEALGTNVSDLSIGDRVLALCGFNGFASDIVLPATSVLPIRRP